MRILKRNYSYMGVIYPATISFKRVRNLSLRYRKEDQSLRASVPYHYLYALPKVDDFIKKALPRLLKRVQAKEEDYDNGELYVFGEKRAVGDLTEDQVNALLKKEGLPYLKERVAHYSEIMGISEPYKVRIRTMKTRFGVNSATTHSVTFTTRLICFSPEIIDSVVVHELAHHFVRNHQKAFYDVVYRYYPVYDEMHKKLRKGIHA